MWGFLFGFCRKAAHVCVDEHTRPIDEEQRTIRENECVIKGQGFVVSEKHMMLAITEAERAHGDGDYPVGAVLVLNDEVIAMAANRNIRDQSPWLHAEFIVTQMAVASLKRKYLQECILYTTHEPCTMCSGLMLWALPKAVIFGVSQQDISQHTNEQKVLHWRSSGGSLCQHIKNATDAGHSQASGIQVIGGFMRERCLKLFNL